MKKMLITETECKIIHAWRELQTPSCRVELIDEINCLSGVEYITYNPKEWRITELPTLGDSRKEKPSAKDTLQRIKNAVSYINWGKNWGKLKRM